MDKERLVIAVPNGFRDVMRGPSRHTDWSKLADPSRRLMEKGCELPYEAGGPDNPYYGFARGFPVEFVEMRGQDIPTVVGDEQSGIDLGITGKDRVDNSSDQLLSQIEIVRPLPFGRCDFTLGVDAKSDIFSADSTLEDVAGLRIATSLEVIARKILAERGVDAEIVPLTGRVETAIRYHLADAIMDITETGGTMRGMGVTPAERLRSFYAVLIGKKGSLDGNIDVIRSWVLDRIDMALANPSTWMTPKERQARNGNGGMYQPPMLPSFAPPSGPEVGLMPPPTDVRSSVSA